MWLGAVVDLQAFRNGKRIHEPGLREPDEEATSSRQSLSAESDPQLVGPDRAGLNPVRHEGGAAIGVFRRYPRRPLVKRIGIVYLRPSVREGD